MRTPIARLAFAFAFAAAAGSARAEGASKDEAQRVEIFEKALADYQNGRWADAVEKLERVVKMRRTSEALRGLALAEKEMGRLLSARRHAREAIELAKGRSDEEAVCKKVLAAIEPLVPQVAVTLPDGVEDARILLDGEPASVENGVLEVDPGERTLRVEAPGYEPFQDQISLSAGSQKSVTAMLRAVASKTEAPRSRAGWIGGGVTLLVVGAGGAAASAIGLGVSSVLRNVLDQNCPGGGCPAAYQGFQAEYNLYFPLAVTGMVLSGLALAGGVTLFVLMPSATPKKEPTAPSASLYVGPASLGVTGSF